MLQQNSIQLNASDKAIDWLSQLGFDPQFGARPLKRAIQTLLENPLAQQLLAGEFLQGDTIVISEEHGQFQFHKKRLH